jgi:hypothetical protein
MSQFLNGVRPSTMRPGHATRRWLMIVVAVLESSDDVPTITQWSDLLHASAGTIKRSCYTCGVRAGDSLDFARILRIVVRFAGESCSWFEFLDIAEPATMRRLLNRAGCSQTVTVPDLSAFLTHQRLITDAHLISAVFDAVTQLRRSLSRP